MIKTINLELLETTQKLQTNLNIITENCSLMLDDGCLTLCESAEGFLGILVAKLNAGKTLDPNNTAIRNMFGVLAALDLMRYPQARKVIDSNTIRAYLDVINGIETATTMNQTEVKLLNNLEHMKNSEGVGGMDVRAKYLELAKSNPDELLKDINKLRTTYGQITAKLKTAASSDQPAQKQTPQPEQQPKAAPQPATT